MNIVCSGLPASMEEPELEAEVADAGAGFLSKRCDIRTAAAAVKRALGLRDLRPGSSIR